MGRLWDQQLADKAAAIDQATKLGGVVVSPPRSTGFAQEPPKPSPPRSED